MDNDWEIAKRVFTRAIQLAPEKRQAFLERSRLSSSIRREVESLLAHQDDTNRVFGIPSSIGDHLLSHYRILGQIGAGGMGLVYKARDEKLDRLVAVKVLLPWAMGDPTSRARLLEEARCTAALNHPHIVTIHEFAREKDIDFIVMEFLDGKTLDRHIPGRGLILAKALTWAQEIGGALAAAHAIGIFHQDLKSSNVMVTRDKGTKLLDFGLALRPGGSSEKLTFGTKAYMAPELLAENRAADQRSEIYSFGLMLYHMFSGKKTFLQVPDHSGPSTPTYAPVPPSIKGHTGIAQTVRRCLENDPDRRFQSISEVLSSLQSASEFVGYNNRVASPRPPNLGPVKLLRAEIRRINYANLPETRRAFARIASLLETTDSENSRQMVVSSLKNFLLHPPSSGNEVSALVREVRRLALDLLRKTTQGHLACFQIDDLEQLDLYDMNFGGVALDHFSFRNAFLVEADFQDSNLRGASFDGASIRNAIFTGANLTDVDFTDADWFHATGLTEDQLIQSKRNTLRVCPPTTEDLHRHLAARYVFPFSSWGDDVQKQIVAAWDVYLRPGGLRDVVARWRGLS